MAAKKTSQKRSTSSEPSLKQQTEQLQRTLGETAQQIWLAGVGAFGRAQTKGSRLFDTLVKEGSRVEQRTGSRAGRLRDTLDSGVHEARARATETFGRVDKAFRSKVQGTLQALEVPTRRELGTLLNKIESLNSQLRRHNSQTDAPVTKARKSATKKTAARKAPVAASPPKKSASKTTAPRKAVKSPASKVATKKVTRTSAARKPVR